MQNTFRCNACGTQFAGDAQELAQNPTCARCGTFGQIIGPDGQFVSQAQTVVKIQQPNAGGSGPYQQAPNRAPGLAEDYDDYVEVDGGAMLGTTKSNKNLVTTLVFVATGIGIVTMLWLIVSTLKEDRSEAERQEREVVQDPADFEKEINKSIANVKKTLSLIKSVEIEETTDFSEVMDIISQTKDCDTLILSAPVVPGSPFKYKGFVVKAPYEKKPGVFNHGFIMLLYYKTAQEVVDAESEIRQVFGGSRINYGYKADSSIWYITYSGCRYRDIMQDKILDSRTRGAPTGLRQFTDRVGSTGKGQ